MPMVIRLLVVLDLGALHDVGSNNPDGVDIKKIKDERGIPADGIPFHPYYTVKDLFGASFFLTIMAFILFYAPTFGDLFLERSEEHTSELQSLMRISYAVFCLKKKNKI